MVMLMVGIAEWTGEKEIIFPEMAALAVGLWVIDKRVWKVGRWQLIGLMTAGAVAGVCIVRYSTLPLLCNLCLAFAFAACPFGYAHQQHHHENRENISDFFRFVHHEVQ